MGLIELVKGPMYCGKTDELVRRVKREAVVGKKYIAFKPRIDKRYSETHIVAHSGAKLKAFPVSNTSQIYRHLRDTDAKIIAIDEIQFLDDRIIDFCREFMARRDAEVIASGLDLDYRREPFTFRGSKRHMGEIEPYCHVTHLRSKCTFELEGGEKCDSGADFTQRLVHGVPAHYSGETVKVGGKKVTAEDMHYEARCLKHHFVLGKDEVHTSYWKE